MATVEYTPDGPVLSQYLKSNAFMRVIVGPFGSGKTVASCVEIFRRSCEQAPGPDKVRRSRWMIVRNTYPRLQSTTIPTWREWFDERFGRFNWTPPITHHMVLPLDDGTVVDLEVLFVALDNPDGQAALKGFEPTGIFFNELAEIPRGIVNFALGRVGRFPPQAQGGPSWYGVLGDSNQVDADHWLAGIIADPPKNWDVVVQPGGVVWDGERWVDNPAAENTKYLPGNYYTTQMGGQSEDFIKVYLGNLPGYVQDGRAVFPEFNDALHVASEPFGPIKDLPLYVGLDFGLTLRREFSSPLLNVSALVRQAGETWVRLHNFRVPLNTVVATAQGRDQHIFAQAASNYRSILDREGWIDDAGLVALLEGLVRNTGPASTIGIRTDDCGTRTSWIRATSGREAASCRRPPIWSASASPCWTVSCSSPGP